MDVKVFADTNIVIDLIQNRNFARKEVKSIFLMAEQDEIDLYISESVITNTLYITGLHNQLLLLLKFVHTCCINKSAIQTALAGNFRNKEDAVLYFGALHNNMDYFLTRDVKDFKQLVQESLPVVTPKQFLKLIAGKKSMPHP